MENRDYSVKIVMITFGYTKEEAINVLNGLNPDGTENEQLPF